MRVRVRVFLVFMGVFGDVVEWEGGKFCICDFVYDILSE